MEKSNFFLKSRYRENYHDSFFFCYQIFEIKVEFKSKKKVIYRPMTP